MADEEQKKLPSALAATTNKDESSPLIDSGIPPSLAYSSSEDDIPPPTILGERQSTVTFSFEPGQVIPEMASTRSHQNKHRDTSGFLLQVKQDDKPTLVPHSILRQQDVKHCPRLSTKQFGTYATDFEGKSTDTYLLGTNRVRGPNSAFSSLDFERIVNCYSVRATRSELLTKREAVERAVRHHLSWSVRSLETSEVWGMLDSLSQETVEGDEESGDKGNRACSFAVGGRAPLKKRPKRLLGYTGRTATRWLLTCLTGLLTGLITVFILSCTEIFSKIRLRRIGEGLAALGNPDSENTGHSFQRYYSVCLEYCAINLFLAVSSSFLCLWLSPEAVGSGIPEMIAYLNGVRVKRFQDFKLFCVKIIGTILSVSSGLAIGPEGPLVHLGAIVGASLTKASVLMDVLVKACPKVGNIPGCAPKNSSDQDDELEGERSTSSSTISSLSNHLRYFSGQDAERRDLISIGAACGFAAAFGAPIGGLLFSLEEASSFFEQHLLWKTIMATAIATMCIALHHGDLQSFAVINIDAAGDTFMNRFSEIPLYILIGTAGGLLGATFIGLWKMMFKRRKEFFEREHLTSKGRNAFRLGEVAALSLLTSLLTFTLPLTMNWSCRDIDRSLGHSYQRLNCRDGELNELGSVLLGSRDEAIKNILRDPSVFDKRTLLLVGVLFFPLYLVTFGVALPSGIFMPTILTGSSLGAYCGVQFEHYISSNVSPSTYALLGAAALLSGIQRNTVSLCVILVEGTGQVKVLIPVIITVVVARYAGDMINHGIYHVAMELRNYPFLDHRVKKTMDILKVKDIMSLPPRVVYSIDTAGNIESLLMTSRHHAYPVVNHNHKFVGVVRRDQLVALLECGIFMEKPTNILVPMPSPTCDQEESRMAISRTAEDDLRRESVFTDYSRCHQNLIKSSYNGNEWYWDKVRHSRKAVILTGDDTLPCGLNERKEGRIVTVDNGYLVIHLLQEDQNKYVDVAAVMNFGAYCVTEFCPLSKAYFMFTALGLRHLVVLGGNSGGEVVGIISRGNLNHSFIQERGGFQL